MNKLSKVLLYITCCATLLFIGFGCGSSHNRSCQVRQYNQRAYSVYPRRIHRYNRVKRVRRPNVRRNYMHRGQRQHNHRMQRKNRYHYNKRHNQHNRR